MILEARRLMLKNTLALRKSVMSFLKRDGNARHDIIPNESFLLWAVLFTRSWRGKGRFQN